MAAADHPHHERAPLIVLRELSKTYCAGEVEVHAVRNVSLLIERGDFVAIMGASGSGKSTLMNIVGCLDSPSAGNYLLDGIDVADLRRGDLAKLRNRKIGFVFQSFNLLSRTTALENVELPMFYTRPLVALARQRRRATEVLAQVGLADRVTHRPNQLSGGQQQRIAIARALVNKPDLLLADEPTGNLDSRTSSEIMGLFQTLNDAGITIVIVTHDPDISSYAKRVVAMRDGMIVGDTLNEQRRRASNEHTAVDQPELEAQLR